MPVYRLDKEIIAFPDPKCAEDDGLLAVGGDLSIDRLLLAYSHGIFPWYRPEEEILWWCPKERYIIRPESIHVSHSMKKFMKKHNLSIEINRDFADTIHRCRQMREFTGTWITDAMEEAYINLHKAGFAISVEAFEEGELAGGLYGVSLGRCFYGESMFSVKENGSKVALIALANVLRNNNFVMIDCQMPTNHLKSMGAECISYDEYMGLVKEGLKNSDN